MGDVVAEGPLLEVQDLVVDYRTGFRQPVHRALSGVGLVVRPGEVVAIVGESGSGKTTLANAILGLVPIAGGSISLEGVQITGHRRREERKSRHVLQAVFQDPYSSLNPGRRIRDSVAEPLMVGVRGSKESVIQRVIEVLADVGLSPISRDLFPGQLSGGQRQRVAIARALIAEPKLIVCDEPVSALDVSIQGQILNLISDVRSRLGVAFLIISHDLDVVRCISDRTVVLYRGQIVEEGATSLVCVTPSHEYTKALLAASPAVDPAERMRRGQLRKAANFDKFVLENEG
jgi:peptide/nickel transport system ATP-binding protein